MSNFFKKIKCEWKSLRSVAKKHYNLSNLQKTHLNILCSNKDFVILSADKNLGPAIMERDLYIKNILDGHLLSFGTYRQLTEKQGNEMIQQLKKNAWNIIYKKRNKL